MKNLLTLCFVFFVAFNIQAQKGMDKVTADICECIKEKDLSSISRPDASQLVEDCITNASLTNLEFFMEGVDPENSSKKEIEDIMRKKGEAIGMHAAQNCPKFMELMTVIASVEEESSTELPQSEFVIVGKLAELNEEEFFSINIEEADGRKHKLYWMQHFDGAMELKKIKKGSLGKDVEVSYKKVESYNPKLQDYAPIKVITGISWK